MYIWGETRSRLTQENAKYVVSIELRKKHELQT